MKTSRRTFLGYGLTTAAAAASLRGTTRAGSAGSFDIIRPPDHVTAYAEEIPSLALKRAGQSWRARDVEVATEVRQSALGPELAIGIRSPQTSLTRVHLRWSGRLAEDLLFLGDQWERAYGGLAWRSFDADRIMPWYFIATSAAGTQACGVKTGARAFCFWQTDAAGISLWLDVRNGGRGVRLGARRLGAATVVSVKSEPGAAAFPTARRFCHRLSETPRLPAEPIYGSNNWYYLYGKNMTESIVLADVDQLAALSPAVANRPYMVIDMGYGKAPGGAGPWTQANCLLPDMPGLAAKIKKRGVRPGIWVRPLLTVEPLPEAWYLAPKHPGRGSKAAPRILDPSVPEALDHIQKGLRGVTGWGFELVKHDYSTFDLMGRWGFRMGAELTSSGWHFADRSRTSAEIILNFYHALREAVGNAPLLGCNTVGHLGAGIFEAQRIGDDTSGRDWNRTRKMGVNALGFRMPQHRTFFLIDPDCVPVTHAVPFQMTRQWCELVARSGTLFFISADPATATARDKKMLKAALKIAAVRQPQAEPLDWMQTMSPGHWKFGGAKAGFDWFGEEGANPFAS